MADSPLPDWWTYPKYCGRGHAWGPGRVLVSWMPCQCDPAREAQLRGSGHRLVECRAPGCGWTDYEPRHDPATAGLPRVLGQACPSHLVEWVQK
jgi:hypothetical protein